MPKFIIEEAELVNRIFDELHSCDGEVLAQVAGLLYGGQCYAIDGHYEFYPDSNYFGAFGPVPEVDESEVVVITTQSVSYSFRVPYYDDKCVFSHYVYPESSFSPTESGYLEISFKSPEEAYAFLDEYNLREEAVEDKWILIKSTDEVMGYVEQTN